MGQPPSTGSGENDRGSKKNRKGLREPWKKGQSGNPTGRPKKVRADVWTNEYSGLGTSADPRMASYHVADYVNDAMARDLWIGNDLAARAIEAYPQDGMRGGYTFESGDDKTERLVVEAVAEVEGDLSVRRGAEYERAYGGGAIYPVVNDAVPDLGLPLRMKSMQRVERLLVLEPRELYPAAWEDGSVSIWRMVRLSPGGAPPPPILIHASRLIAFPGIKVSNLAVSRHLWGWGHAILTRMHEVLRDAGISWSALATLLVDFAQGVLAIPNLAELLATNEGQAQIRARFSLMDMSRSVLRTLLIDSTDRFERQQTPVTGLADLIDRLMQRLAASVDMPVTRLMKISPAGMNATGESDTRNWYDSVAAYQKDKLQAPVERLLEIVMNTKDGPTGGREPKQWELKWKPLWLPTDLEIAQTHSAQAEADLKTVNSGMASPDELTRNRFGKSGYSLNTVIDLDERAKLQPTLPPPGSPEAIAARTPGGPLVVSTASTAASAGVDPQEHAAASTPSGETGEEWVGSGSADPKKPARAKRGAAEEES